MAEHQKPPARLSTTRLRANRSPRGRDVDDHDDDTNGTRLFGERRSSRLREFEVDMEVLSSDDDDHHANGRVPAAAALPVRQPKRKEEEDDDDDSSISSSSQVQSRRHRRRRRRRARHSSSSTGTKTTGLSDSETAPSPRNSGRHQPNRRHANPPQVLGSSQDEPIELNDDDDDDPNNNNPANARLLAMAATEDDPIVIESSDSELEAMVGEAIQRSLEDQKRLWEAASRKSNHSNSSHRLRSSGRPTSNSQRRKTFSPMPVARKKAPPKRSKSSQQESKPAVKPSAEILASTRMEADGSSSREAKDRSTTMGVDTSDQTRSDAGGIANRTTRSENPIARTQSEPEEKASSNVQAGASEQETQSQRGSSVGVPPFNQAAANQTTHTNENDNVSSEVAANKDGTIKQEEDVTFPKSRKGNKKFPRNSKDLGCHVQVAKGSSSCPTDYSARIVLDEQKREMISDAGFVLVQWEDCRREEVLLEGITRIDETTGRSRRKRVEPKKLQGSDDEEEGNSDTTKCVRKSRRARCKLEPETDESHTESDWSIPEQAAKAQKRQVRSTATQRQSKRNKLCSDDSMISTESLDVKPAASAKRPPKRRDSQEPPHEAHDDDAAASEPVAAVQQQEEGRRPAIAHPASRYAHLPIGPHPKPIVSRYMKDPPKQKYIRPKRPGIGDIVYLLEGAVHGQSCIRPVDLYKGQPAKVVGESIFAFMSPHEHLLQLEVCDENGQKHSWYVQASVVNTPRLLDR